MAKRLFAILLLLFALAPQAWAAAVDVPLPSSVYAAVPGLHLLGAGRLYWFLFHVYDAALYVDGSSYAPQSAPFALAIHYQRDFSSQELARTSLREMDRLSHPDPSLRRRFAAELAHAFPSVRPGDEIVGLCIPNQYTAFYYNGKLYSKIDNPQFCPAFFGIWLDPQTRVPGLRRQLLHLGHGDGAA
ncbi:chalcone isomerase family protein [Acidithiobacillus sp. AMEEHan]|uniref:chalcone isomerase family protein n=1 Tax=Acidithiobacillus sp. AMEEHan TaxID=2994951 RepID=UPI0027E3EC98|nr:chalcone isomerase family protein [Acidithiobacillus sp. AMEEHan]